MNITATLLAQIAAFLILIWMVNKFLSKPLNEALEKRRERIEKGLEAAKKGEKELAAAEERKLVITREAHAESEQIIARANEHAADIINDARVAASVEAEQIKATAKEDIDRQTTITRAKLRAEVAALALAGAEAVVGREIDKETHREALNAFAQRL